MPEPLIDLQIACTDALPISQEQLVLFVQTALEAHASEAQVTLRLVDVPEIIHLNKTYRNRDKATNVLAFPSTVPKEIPVFPPLLGDVVIAPAVLAAEAIEQNRALDAHWAHITLHGVLHLLGYDHTGEKDTQHMQAMEIGLLNKLGFCDPYATIDKDKERV